MPLKIIAPTRRPAGRFRQTRPEKKKKKKPVRPEDRLCGAVVRRISARPQLLKLFAFYFPSPSLSRPTRSPYSNPISFSLSLSASRAPFFLSLSYFSFFAPPLPASRFYTFNRISSEMSPQRCPVVTTHAATVHNTPNAGLRKLFYYYFFFRSAYTSKLRPVRRRRSRVVVVVVFFF